jgi:delta24-sterol reductase
LSFRFTPAPDFEKVACQKRMERFVIDRAGFVALYAETELSLDDFNEMLSANTDVYNKLRKELNCEAAFPHVYEKISKLGRK